MKKLALLSGLIISVYIYLSFHSIYNPFDSPYTYNFTGNEVGITISRIKKNSEFSEVSIIPSDADMNILDSCYFFGGHRENPVLDKDQNENDWYYKEGYYIVNKLSGEVIYDGLSKSDFEKKLNEIHPYGLGGGSFIKVYLNRVYLSFACPVYKYF